MENIGIRMENLQQRAEELAGVAAGILYHLKTDPRYADNEKERDAVLKALCELQDAVDVLAGGALIYGAAIRRGA